MVNRIMGVEYKKCSVSVMSIFGNNANKIKNENTRVLLLFFSVNAEYFFSEIK